MQILSVPKKNETVHSPPFSLKTVDIERFALLAAIVVAYLPTGRASRFIVGGGGGGGGGLWFLFPPPPPPHTHTHTAKYIYSGNEVDFRV